MSYVELDPADFIGDREIPRMTDAERRAFDKAIAVERSQGAALREQKELFKAARDRRSA